MVCGFVVFCFLGSFSLTLPFRTAYSQPAAAELLKTIHILYVFSEFFIKEPKSFALTFTTTLLKTVSILIGRKNDVLWRFFSWMQCFRSALGCLSKGTEQSSMSKAVEKTVSHGLDLMYCSEVL